MVGRHHRVNRHEFEQSLGGSEGQGSLVCRSPWDCRVGHDLVTEWQQHILKATALVLEFLSQLQFFIYLCDYLMDVCLPPGSSLLKVRTPLVLSMPGP